METLVDRRLRRKERASDGRDTQSAQRLENQRKSVLRGQPGLTAHEDHPELVVLDPILLERLVDRPRQRPFAVQVEREVRSEGSASPLATDRVDRPVSGRREQPPGGVVGDSVLGPGAERCDEGLLGDVFRELQVVRAQDPGQDGNEPSGLPSEEGFDLRTHVHETLPARGGLDGGDCRHDGATPGGSPRCGETSRLGRPYDIS